MKLQESPKAPHFCKRLKWGKKSIALITSNIQHELDGEKQVK
jgi:hypothetical protein